MSNKFDEINKDGFVLSHAVLFDNLLMREICINVSVQCALLYVLILSHRNMTDGKCFPSRQLLARETGQSVPTVARQLKQLEDFGYIKTHSGASGRSNMYYFPKERFYNNDGFMAQKKRNVFNKKLNRKLQKIYEEAIINEMNDKSIEEYIDNSSHYVLFDSVDEFSKYNKELIESF